MAIHEIPDVELPFPTTEKISSYWACNLYGVIPR